ncbi:hypothetical protein BDN72DRAFT_849903 [Pluteus cervinus]|uniref:Uncharacterized protein n=1 Tax=Pluteus cervinus TaxID=181527 RepID=A0ACD3A5U9_9AGAR|nr:hypothetical protein BDN72DRAFT_849903 [Pluteus cervinus]
MSSSAPTGEELFPPGLAFVVTLAVWLLVGSATVSIIYIGKFLYRFAHRNELRDIESGQVALLKPAIGGSLRS